MPAAALPTRPAPERPLRKKERTRREIYAAAMALFARRGFEQVTVEQVCEAAGIAKATFFTHFPTKSALLLEFQREVASELAARPAGPRASAAQELRQMVEHFAARWLPHAEVMGAMLRDFLATPALVATARRQDDVIRGLIEDVVRHGQARGEFSRALSPRLVSAMFLATSAAILSGLVYADGEATAEEVREQFLSALLHGLALRPAAGRVASPSRPVAKRAAPPKRRPRR